MEGRILSTDRCEKKEDIEVKNPLVKLSAIPFCVGAILFIICLLSSILITVPTGHTGILTTFGNVEDATLDAGLHAKKPWQEVISMDNRVQKETVELSCFSSDIQEVEIKYTLNYRIDKGNAQNIYKSIGKEYYKIVVAPSIAEAVKVVTARYTAESLVSSRDVLAISIEELLAKQLETNNIKVVATAIEDMDFTNEFTNAVEAKQVAVQNKLKAQTEQEQATMIERESAERQKISAQAQAEIAKIQAEADLEVQKINADAAEYTGQKEAAKNTAIAQSLTQDLIKYYYIEQWDGKLPETYVGDNDVSTIIVP